MLEKKKGLIVYFKAFILFVSIQCVGYVCIAEPRNILQRRDDFTLKQKLYCIHQSITAKFINITTDNGQRTNSMNSCIKLAVEVIENRFIAKGIITDIKRDSKGIQKFSLQIKIIGPFKDYPNFGGNYIDKTVEIFSEIGIPSSFQVGMEISVVLRVSGDEWGQTLFLVEVIEDGTKK